MVYGRKKTEFIEGETRLIQPRIELIDATVASCRMKSLEKSVQSWGFRLVTRRSSKSKASTGPNSENFIPPR